ncbi:hypothetical protein SADUNF_Sadunf16G0032500 [Salix dunnii]|uniref:Uncharacterized protein n=1 Tax=Salix dunnii TaxID=1413687 RepID=A0A835J7P6_9ROSI|nr:hypothetical protein SADUNF_Sadunf16G0032500 [Salix dunnii]
MRARHTAPDRGFKSFATRYQNERGNITIRKHVEFSRSTGCDKMFSLDNEEKKSSYHAATPIFMQSRLAATKKQLSPISYAMHFKNPLQERTLP